MRLSKKFISEYTSLDNIDFHEYADKMLKLGNEYESITKLVKATKLITGEVISCEKHPESDHLNVCKVDIGSEVLNIICGAPNVREGLKVIVALDGAELPGGTIKKTVILGYESNGMICSLAELGLDNKYLSPEDINGIHELPEEAIVGDDPIKFLELDDEVIDFELTANRADLLSVLGLAYETSVITGGEVSLPDTSSLPIDLPSSSNVDISSIMSSYI
jgi:phenylalanyl-tRNA synthetase beta chain